MTCPKADPNSLTIYGRTTVTYLLNLVLLEAKLFVKNSKKSDQTLKNIMMPTINDPRAKKMNADKGYWMRKGF